MMWRVPLMLVILAMTSGTVQAEVRVVFKSPGGAALRDRTPLKRMTFGLSTQQVDRIFALSQNTVQFGDVFYADQSLEQVRELKDERGFAGVIYPNVPPPFEPGADHPQPEQRIGDPELAGQWWIERLGVPEAWPMATGAGVTIADCDAGYFHDEQDLFSNMLLAHRFDLSDADAPHVVNDGPFASHGTSVSAILSGVLNGVGTNGIAYNSKIVPLQNYNYNGSDDLDKEEATARCVLRAITVQDVNIIVLENQTATGSSETFIGTRDAVRLAQKAGIIVVSAAGNYSAELLEEQKDDTGSIIVGALLRDDSIPYWSNYGERITIAAYGEKLRTLSGPNGSFSDFGGTSGATPQVAATVAMMKEINPQLTPEQARSILTETRDMIRGSEKVGGKLLVPAAVLAARSTPADWFTWNKQWLFRQQLRAILLNP